MMPNSSPIDRREEVEQCDREAAAEVAASLYNPLWSKEIARSCREGKRDATDLVQAFAAHRLAERERCAGIAEDMGKESKNITYHVTCKQVATAIRSPNPEAATCDLCVGECRGHSLGHPEQWIPEPGSRATLTPTTGKDEGNG